MHCLSTMKRKQNEAADREIRRERDARRKVAEGIRGIPDGPRFTVEANRARLAAAHSRCAGRVWDLSLDTVNRLDREILREASLQLLDTAGHLGRMSRGGEN
jgi:hypothetical protein